MKVKEFDDNALQESKISILNELTNVNVDGIVMSEIIVQGLRFLNMQMDRAGFLREYLLGVCCKEKIEQIIQNPSLLINLPLEVLDNVAQRVIDDEEKRLFCLEKVDLITYFAYMDRVFFKLLYLYGVPELVLNGKADIPLESVYLLTLCIGAGYGIHEAEYALEVALRAYRVGVKQRLINTSLTKGGLYPFVKKTELFLELYITQTAFEKLDAFRSGGLSFQTCCKRLQEILRSKK